MAYARILGGTGNKPVPVKKKAKVPEKSVGVLGQLALKAARAVAAIIKSKTAAADVFSARASARAEVNNAATKATGGVKSAVPLIARTTSAHPDNVAGLNRPYIQVLSLQNDPGTADVSLLKGKSNIYDTFIISSVNLIDAEKLDVVETFGTPHFFASGRFTKKAVISGVVRSQPRNPMASSTTLLGGQAQNVRIQETNYINRVPDYVVFRNFYETYLRATLQAASNSFTRIYVDGDYYDGFVQNLTFNISAESEQTIPWSMSMLLMRSWNTLDSAAQPLLAKFMDPLKNTRDPITNREALLELSDLQGQGKVLVNGTSAFTAKSVKYVNGEPAVVASNTRISVSDTAQGFLTVEFPPEIASAVTLVRDGADNKSVDLNATVVKKGESIPVKLKVNSLAALYALAEGDGVKKLNVGVRVSANGNTDGSCGIYFPLELEGGEAIKVAKAEYTTTSGLQLTATIEATKDPSRIEAVVRVPFASLSEFYPESGKSTGVLTYKLTGKAGNAITLTDHTKAKLDVASLATFLADKNLAPSKESADSKVGRMGLSGTPVSAGLSDAEISAVEFPVESENAVFNVDDVAGLGNPFNASEAIIYPISVGIDLPGYAKTAIYTRFIVELSTPAALKGVILQPAKASVTNYSNETFLDITVPIADSAYVDGALPAPTVSRLSEVTANVRVSTPSGEFSAFVPLRTGINVNLRGQTSGSYITVSGGQVYTNTKGAYFFQSKMTLTTEGKTFANFRPTSATVTVTDPFKK